MSIGIDDEVAEIIQQLQLWHGNGIGQLQKILDHKGSDMLIADIPIPAGSDISKGLRVGIMLAIKFLGKLPIELEENI